MENEAGRTKIKGKDNKNKTKESGSRQKEKEGIAFKKRKVVSRQPNLQLTLNLIP